MLGVIGAVFGPTKDELDQLETEASQKEEAAAVAKRESATKVTAAELFAAYQSNEARAQRDYGGKLLEVSATIDSIALGIGDEPYLTLKTANEFMSAHADLTKAGQTKSADLSKGEKVTLLCKDIGEIAGIPMLKDCEIL